MNDVDKNMQRASEPVFLRHFLDTKSLQFSQIKKVLDLAKSFFDHTQQNLKKLPLLRGKTIATLFFEPSTRTRTTFELAAKRLSADVLNIDTGYSSSKKGESLLDTVRNLEAMQVDMFVVRHFESGAAHFLAQQVKEGVSVINAGDGCHQHPTQAMLDVFTIYQKKPVFSDLVIVILGDVEHSRVARSQIYIFLTLGVKEIRIVCPRTLFSLKEMHPNIRYFDSVEEGLCNADVVIVLRLQKERMDTAFLPNFDEYFTFFGLTKARLALAKPDAMVMHPGPVNRFVEIVSEIVDGPQSVVLQQVTNGIAVRMAVMTLLADHARQVAYGKK